MLEILTPGVQDGGDADAGAEVLGIGRNGGERIGCGREQQSVPPLRASDATLPARQSGAVAARFRCSSGLWTCRIKSTATRA